MRLNKNKINFYKKKYSSNGYVVIKELFNRDDIERAKEDLENVFYKNVKTFKGRNINKTKDNIINSIHFMNNWKWYKIFKNNKNLKQIVPILLDDRPKNFGSELFAKPAKVGMPSPMHQDNYYWCVDNANGLTIWVALDDSSKKNGGVFYFNKSHQLGLLEHAKSYAPGSSQTLRYPNSMKFFKQSIPNIKKGDCIIHHSLVVHGSHHNTSNFPRRGLTIRYIGSKSKIDMYRKKKYEFDLKKSRK